MDANNWTRWLSATLEAAGMTRAELSRVAGVPESTISRWFTRKFRPTRERVRAVGEVFGAVGDALDAAGYNGEAEREAFGAGWSQQVVRVEASIDQLEATIDDLRKKVDALHTARDELMKHGPRDRRGPLIVEYKTTPTSTPPTEEDATRREDLPNPSSR